MPATLPNKAGMPCAPQNPHTPGELPLRSQTLTHNRDQREHVPASSITASHPDSLGAWSLRSQEKKERLQVTAQPTGPVQDEVSPAYAKFKFMEFQTLPGTKRPTTSNVS